MNISKRLLSVLLALTLLTSIFSLPAFADDVRVRSISIIKTPRNNTIEVDKSHQLDVRIKPADASDDDISWETSNDGVCDVDGDGLITGVSTGVATITAKASNGRKATVRIRVGSNAKEKATRVKITPEKKVLKVGQQVQLVETVYPRDTFDDYVEWYSDDENICAVDKYGFVKAIRVGETTIVAETEMGRKGYCEVTVIGKNESISDYEDKDDSKSSSNTSKPTGGGKVVKVPSVTTDKKATVTTSTSKTSTSKITSSDVTNAIKSAQNKKNSKKNISVKFNNVASVSSETLKAANKANSDAKLVFVSKTDKKLHGQITVFTSTTAKAKKAINPGLTTTGTSLEKVTKKLNKNFKNEMHVIKADQSGSYGITVRVATKIDTDDFNTKKLRFYSYNSKTNKIKEITNTNYSVNDSGYVHFNTSVGDYLVISEGQLKK